MFVFFVIEIIFVDAGLTHHASASQSASPGEVFVTEIVSFSLFGFELVDDAARGCCWSRCHWWCDGQHRNRYAFDRGDDVDGSVFTQSPQVAIRYLLQSFSVLLSVFLSASSLVGHNRHELRVAGVVVFLHLQEPRTKVGSFFVDPGSGCCQVHVGGQPVDLLQVQVAKEGLGLFFGRIDRQTGASAEDFLCFLEDVDGREVHVGELLDVDMLVEVGASVPVERERPVASTHRQEVAAPAEVAVAHGVEFERHTHVTCVFDEYAQCNTFGAVPDDDVALRVGGCADLLHQRVLTHRQSVGGHVHLGLSAGQLVHQRVRFQVVYQQTCQCELFI